MFLLLLQRPTRWNFRDQKYFIAVFKTIFYYISCITTTTLQQHLKNRLNNSYINITQQRDQENSREWRDPRKTWAHHKTKNERQLRLTARSDCVSRRHSKVTHSERQLRHTKGLAAVSRGQSQKKTRKIAQLKGWSDFRNTVIFPWKKVITCITGNFYFSLQSCSTMRGSMLPSTFKVLFRMLSTAFLCKMSRQVTSPGQLVQHEWILLEPIFSFTGPTTESFILVRGSFIKFQDWGCNAYIFSPTFLIFTPMIT